MELIDIVTLGLPEAPHTGLNKFPTLYALSKTGAIRIYEISVEDKGDHAVLTTSKKLGEDGKCTKDSYEYWEGVNIGKSNETSFYEQAMLNAASVFKKLQDSGFTVSVPDKTNRYNTDANGRSKPMLAIGFDESKIKFPCLCQPKYDGVRCMVSIDSDGVHIISRKGKVYRIPHLERWAKENPSMLPLDGELYCHKELTFQQITSAVKKLSGITGKIKYVVYDKPIEDVDNRQRWSILCNDFKSISRDAPVYLSPAIICNNMAETTDYLKKCHREGYEGIIIRNFDGEYEFGFRSDSLIKMKPFMDGEFKIINVVEAKGRDAGTAIFVCECSGGIFRVKPQGTRELRSEYWRDAKKLIGKMVTVKYQELSDSGIPRFPTAIAIRDYE